MTLSGEIKTVWLQVKPLGIFKQKRRRGIDMLLDFRKKIKPGNIVLARPAILKLRSHFQILLKKGFTVRLGHLNYG